MILGCLQIAVEVPTEIVNSKSFTKVNQDMINEVDCDGNGVIDFPEFLSMPFGFHNEGEANHQISGSIKKVFSK